MRHVLVFAKTPYERTPYDRWLAGTGVAPIILTTQQYAPGYAHLPQVASFDDYDGNQLVDQAALRLARAHRVEAVFARAEVDVLRAAQLRDLLDLPGQRTASAVAFRNKVVMKDHLLGGPVEIPRYRAIESVYALLEFVEEHGYPVVIKPVSESGSLGASIVRDEADLERYLRHPWPGSSQIETFVPGRMYHVDGLQPGIVERRPRGLVAHDRPGRVSVSQGDRVDGAAAQYGGTDDAGGLARWRARLPLPAGSDPSIGRTSLDVEDQQNGPFTYPGPTRAAPSVGRAD